MALAQFLRALLNSSTIQDSLLTYKVFLEMEALTFLAVNTLFQNSSGLEERELLFFIPNATDFAKIIEKVEELNRNDPILDLTDKGDLPVNVPNGMFKWYEQNQIHSSRKQIMPFIDKVLQTLI